MPRMNLLLVTLSAALLIPSVALADPLSASEFAQKASVGNVLEIQEGELAVKNATNPKLKEFAAMMVNDHSAAQKKLEAAAKKSGEPNAALDPVHQAMVDALKTKTGPDFDKAYVADQKQAHNDAAQLLTAYQKDGMNKHLKVWARNTLPTVQMHLKAVNAF